jgi:5S rRNA maturation endonuclease (ribonuclease M5)
LSEAQKDLLRGAFAKIHTQGGKIIIATDRDEAGSKLAHLLALFAPEGTQISRHIPEAQKDWNEALIAQIREQQKNIERSQNKGFEVEL